VPIYITSLGAREDIYAAAHASGGVVLHDVINNAFAQKAISKGADGLVAVAAGVAPCSRSACSAHAAAGAGGHAGTKSPFALVQEIRQ
jgi:nitronate monooxygenase